MPPQRELQMYRTMQLIRSFEEAAGTAFRDGRIRGPVHQYVGQEATVRRLGGPRSPVPYAETLENLFRITPEQVSNAATQMVKES